MDRDIIFRNITPADVDTITRMRQIGRAHV